MKSVLLIIACITILASFTNGLNSRDFTVLKLSLILKKKKKKIASCPTGQYSLESNTRDLPVNAFIGANAKVETCVSACSTYSYIGLQNGDECYCGNSYGFYGNISDSDCSEPCAGDGSQNCGGTLKNSIYFVKSKFNFKFNTFFKFGGQM